MGNLYKRLDEFKRQKSIEKLKGFIDEAPGIELIGVEENTSHITTKISSFVLHSEYIFDLKGHNANSDLTIDWIHKIIHDEHIYGEWFFMFKHSSPLKNPPWFDVRFLSLEWIKYFWEYGGGIYILSKDVSFYLAIFVFNDQCVAEKRKILLSQNG